MKRVRALLLASWAAFALPISSAAAQDGYLAAKPDDALLTSEIGAVPLFAAGGEEVGDVENVVVDFDGGVVAIVVGLGGVLGLNERLIAVPPDRIAFSKGEQGPRADAKDTIDVLRAAPTFEPKPK